MVQDALSEGARIEEFEIKQVLGRGGFGITYLAHDNQLNRNVVLKEYMPEGFASRDQNGQVKAPSDTQNRTFQWGLERFSTEAQTLAQFRHPAIVSVQRLLASQSGTAFIVMDYLDGGNLEETVKRDGLFEFEKFSKIFASLLDGCGAIHDLDILHRDIKPLNIMMVDGKPVLIDFGAARQLERQQKGAVSRIFADGYSPLEQYTSNQPQGPFTDIYALAATAYFAFVGEDPAAAPARVAGDELPPLKEIAAGKAPDQFFEAIEWGLQIKSADRPQTVEEWLPAFPDLEDKKVVVQQVTVEGVDRRTLVLSGAAIGGVALAGLGGYLFTRPPTKPDVSDTVRPLKVSGSQMFGQLVEDSFAQITPYQGGAYFVAHQAGRGDNFNLLAQQIDSQLNKVGEGYADRNSFSQGQVIQKLDDDTVLVGGVSDLYSDKSGNTSNKMFIARLDDSGNSIWRETFGKGAMNSIAMHSNNVMFVGEALGGGKIDTLTVIDLDGKRVGKPIEIGKKSDESIERISSYSDEKLISLNYRWRKEREYTSSVVRMLDTVDGEVNADWTISDEAYLRDTKFSSSRPIDMMRFGQDVFVVGMVSDSDVPFSEGGIRGTYVSRIDAQGGKVVWRSHQFLEQEADNKRAMVRSVSSYEKEGETYLFCGVECPDSQNSQIVQLNGEGNVIGAVEINSTNKEFQICDICFDEAGAFAIGNEYMDGKIELRVVRLDWE